MIGAVCVTLITQALDTSPTVSLIGAALGAAIPVLVGYVGPYPHLRAGAAILVTGIALFVTYGGFTWFAFANDQPETFPIPSRLPNPEADGEGNGTVHMTAAGLGIKVSPETLHCRSNECEEPVIITSTGERLLETYGIEFEGEAAAEFGHDRTCENKRLRKDEECRFTVAFLPVGAGGTRTATLVIHQNLPKVPTRVPVEGEFEDGGPPPPPPPKEGDLAASRSSVRCEHVRSGAIEMRDAIQIFFRLRFSHAPDQPPSVFVSAESDLGPRGQSRGASDGERHVALAPLEPDDYGRSHTVIVSIDPREDVPESNDLNNRLRVRVELPPQPGSPQSLTCRAL